MARDMLPSKEEWKKLGFSFTDYQMIIFYVVQHYLEGWSMKSGHYPMWNVIMDENGMRRGFMFYKAEW